MLGLQFCGLTGLVILAANLLKYVHVLKIEGEIALLSLDGNNFYTAQYRRTHRKKDYYSQREDFNFLLQNFRCIIDILAEEVGKHHNRKKKQFLCRKENSYNFVDSFFLTLKMYKHNIYFEQRWDFVQRFKRNKKSPLYFLLREWKARSI